MIPWHVCLWGPNAAACKSLQRISCFQPNGGTTTTGSETWDNPHIVGFEVAYADGRSSLMAGSSGPVPVQCPNWPQMTDPSKNLVSWIQNTKVRPFDEASMVHFEIDGPGGEVVTEMHASGDMNAVKLLTNKNRSCYFGDSHAAQHWFQYRVEEGHLIVGLVCAFGILGGWSFGTRMYSHWHLSGLGVITISEEDLEV